MIFQRQRGQAILGALMLLLVAGVGTLLFVTGSSARGKLDAEAKTATSLAKAKEALIGWSVTNNDRPGVLPCPDTNNDGTAEAISGNECPSYIGRLPWITLGLQEFRDSSGETLWYALSRNYRNSSTAEPVNTDTKGTITVYAETTSTTTTSEAVAVIFAPGNSFNTQDRSSSSTMSCTAPSGTLARNLCAANYLDTAGSINNAVATGPYIAAQDTTNFNDSPPFNDKLLILTAADVMVPVEKRAAREILTLLRLYKTRSASGCDCYPWADISDGVSNTGLLYGRVPLLGATPTNWSAFSSPIDPAPWLINNQWWWVFFYTLADRDSEYHYAGTLIVNGVVGTRVVLISTGAAGTTRPLGSPGTWNTSWWSAYVDDSNNSDLGYWFDTPSSTAYDRDRLYTIP